MLKDISSNLSYFDFPSRIILYQKEGRAILIDSGLDPRMGRKVIRHLKKREIIPELLIITHGHADHFGGGQEIKDNYPGMKVLSSRLAKSMLESPEYEPYYLYSAEPISKLRNKFLMGNQLQVDQVIAPGNDLDILDESWHILDLAGHSPGQIGLINPAGQVLIGDSVFSKRVIEKHGLVYYFNIGQAISTLEKLLELDRREEYNLFIPGHGRPYKSLKEIIKLNLEIIEETLEIIRGEIKKGPQSREELVAHLMQEYQVDDNITQYFLSSSIISAYLTYLKEEKEIRIKVQNGQLRFTSR